jgi:hypothetical protein
MRLKIEFPSRSHYSFRHNGPARVARAFCGSFTKKLRKTVSRVLSSLANSNKQAQPSGGDHSSRTWIAPGLKRPYPEARIEPIPPDFLIGEDESIRMLPYLALLQVGFASHFCHQKCGGLLPHRFALTEKTCLFNCLSAVCFLLHCPSRRPHERRAWPLASTLLYGARTFLPQTLFKGGCQRSPVLRTSSLAFFFC